MHRVRRDQGQQGSLSDCRQYYPGPDDGVEDELYRSAGSTQELQDNEVRIRGSPDFNWKGLKLEDLRWAFQSMHFKREPRWHQLVSMAFAAERNRVGFWHDVGTGKTLAAYWTAQMWQCKRILVICPGAALGSWMGDSKWTDFSAKIISGTTPERKQKIQGHQQVSIVQYEWLKTIYSSLQQNVSKDEVDPERFGQHGTLYQCRQCNNRLVRSSDKLCPICRSDKMRAVPREWTINLGAFAQDFDCVVFDEIHRCNNEKSLQSQICFELSKRVQHVIGLSGTPVDKSLMELFHIHKVLDLGSTFGLNFWRFQFDHFRQENFEWVPREGAEEVILRKWSRVSLSFKREECFDLPECQEEVVRVPQSDEFMAFEDKVINKRPIQGITFFEPSARAIKLKQLTDGFLYLDQEGEKQSLRLKENPKLEALLEILDSGIKIIVFYEYTEVGNLIAEALKERGVRFVRFQGGITPEERISYENTFQTDPSCQVAVAQISVGSEGWNGFAAGMVIFYDIVASPKVRTQCIGRMLRSGQTRKTLVIELVMEYSINEVTKQNQFERRSAVDDYMDYVRNYRRRHDNG